MGSYDDREKGTEIPFGKFYQDELGARVAQRDAFQGSANMHDGQNSLFLCHLSSLEFH